MTTNDAPDLREAFLQTQMMLEQIAHLKSTDFAAVAARIMANRDVLAALSRNEEAGERHPGWTEAGHAWLDAGAPLTPKATPPSDHIASPEGEVGVSEQSMALSVLDDFARKEGWGDARMRFAENDIPTITAAMVAYGNERAANAATPSPAQQSGELREAVISVLRRVQDHAQASRTGSPLGQLADEILSLASTTPPQSREEK